MSLLVSSQSLFSPLLTFYCSTSSSAVFCVTLRRAHGQGELTTAHTRSSRLGALQLDDELTPPLSLIEQAYKPCTVSVECSTYTLYCFTMGAGAVH